MNLVTIKRVDFYLGTVLAVVLKPFVCAAGSFLKRDHTRDVRGKVVVLKLLGGGSLVIAFPSLLDFRKRYPNHPLVLVTTKEVAQFGRVLGIFDEIHEIRSQSLIGLLVDCLTTLFKCFRADLVIDLEVHSRLSTIFSAITCARNRLGFYLEDAFWRRGFCTHLIFFNGSSSAHLFYDRMLRLFDVHPASAEECREHLRGVLPSIDPPGKRRLCIGHCCSDFARERMLTSEQWSSVFASRHESENEWEVCFLGTNRDRQFTDEIIAQIGHQFANSEFKNMCGNFPLAESLAILAHAEKFWGIDSALLHFARLFGIECVSYWGPTNPSTRLREFPGLREEVIYEKIPCSPCVHVTETPPCGGDNVCIQNLFLKGERRDWIGWLNKDEIEKTKEE